MDSTSISWDIVSIVNTMGKYRSILTSHFLIVIAVFLSVVARILLSVNGGKSLFDSGQDAPSYEAAAIDFYNKGWFSDEIHSLPYFPAGYPAFQSLFLHISLENGWAFLVAFQNIFYIVAVIFFMITLSKIFSKIEAYTLGFLLLFIPSFLYSPSENMYESVLASLLIIGFSCGVLLILQQSVRNSWVLIAVGIFSFGLAGFLQVKTAPIGFLTFLIVGLVKSRRILLFAPLVFWGVALNIHRSFIAFGIFSPSTNFGTAIQVSGAKFPCVITDKLTNHTIGQYVQADTDKQIIICAIKHFSSHPLDFIENVMHQARALYGPLGGSGVPTASTWYHGFDFRRITDFLGTIPKNLYLIENIYSILLNVAIIIGFFISLKKFPIWFTSLAAAPVFVISAVHLISDGDARYRLPFLPFQMLFLLVILGVLQRKILMGIKERHAAHPTGIGST